MTATPHQIRGEVSDHDLASKRPRIIAGEAAPSVRRGTLRVDGNIPAQTVIQTIGMVRPVPSSTLMLVLDGSVAGRGARDGLLRALDAIPHSARVGLVIAADQGATVAPQPWLLAQRARIEQALRDHRFIGGQDNATALAHAVSLFRGESGGSLLWVHGPQPVAFAASATRLEQLTERVSSLPRLLLYQIAPGPQRVLKGNPWTEGARTIPTSGAVAEDLTRAISTALGGAPHLATVRRVGTDVTAMEGSPHIARLWAAEEIRRLAGEGERDKAIALAARAAIVTPVSGAVVLETDTDYTRNSLSVPKAGDVPTVPEPEVWALLLVALLAAAWYWRRQSARAVAT